MVAAQTEKNTGKETLKDEALYWFGALPATGEVPYQFPTREAQEDGNYFEVRNVSAFSLWERKSRVWIGKCRFMQALPVKGFLFPAFSELVERQATVEDEMTRTAYPGAFKVMTRREAESVIVSSWRNVVRYANGNRDLMSLANAANGGVPRIQILDLGANGERPPGMSQEDFLERRIAIQEDLTFNPRRDVHVADFVYLIPLEVDPWSIRKEVLGAKADGNDLDIGVCLGHIPYPRINAAFFGSPPKSVAEMYPQFKS